MPAPKTTTSLSPPMPPGSPACTSASFAHVESASPTATVPQRRPVSAAPVRSSGAIVISDSPPQHYWDGSSRQVSVRRRTTCPAAGAGNGPIMGRRHASPRPTHRAIRWVSRRAVPAILQRVIAGTITTVGRRRHGAAMAMTDRSHEQQAQDPGAQHMSSPNATGPLVGLRVLDLTWVLSGPYAAMTLCDLGAEVIKVERPPYGDIARTTGPFLGDESAYFISINRGKQSVSLDLRSPEGKDVFLRLAERVDVVMENFTTGVMARLGLGYEALAARNPRLVMCSVSGFGQTGPDRELPALDIIVQGAGGVMSITGEPGRGPVR